MVLDFDAVCLYVRQSFAFLSTKVLGKRAEDALGSCAVLNLTKSQ
jgi:hypothetical protein